MENVVYTVVDKVGSKVILANVNGVCYEGEYFGNYPIQYILDGTDNTATVEFFKVRGEASLYMRGRDETVMISMTKLDGYDVKSLYSNVQLLRNEVDNSATIEDLKEVIESQKQAKYDIDASFTALLIMSFILNLVFTLFVSAK